MKEINFVSMNEIKQCSKIHFFDKGSMRFFNSRLSEYGYQCKEVVKIGKYDEYNYHNIIFFVTSEKYDHKSPRLYTIRKLTINTGAIETVGDFQQYKSRDTAHRWAQKYAMDN